ncbi:MAG TPA: ABC transporter ATP-binding protein [Candidatus Humimicrobiaceae bacterium]
MNSVISIENIKKTLGNREILKGISFTVERGDIFGYLGPNGAGKTTTIRILLGLFQADSGKLDILGQDISLSETRRKIGFVLDSDGLYESMTAEENMMYYSQIYGLPNAGERIDKLLRMMDLEDRCKDKVGTYSRGMRQRLALARSLVHNPEVLILDEPTAGVDPSGQIEIRQIMLDIVHKENKTIFLSSHNLDEVQRICNRIALIDRGEIKLYGELENLRQKMGSGAVIIETVQNIPDSLMTELKSLPYLGLKEKKERTLIFSPREGTEISDIIGFLSSRGVKIEEAVKKEASLEEMYAAILKEVELS